MAPLEPHSRSPYRGSISARKVILILVTLFVLVAAFTVYFAFQARFNLSAEARKKADQFPNANSSSDQLIKAGSGAWSKQFDKLGNLYYQFKCDYYDPQPDGAVKVTLPVIQFYLSGGQVMQITGKDGIIHFAAGTDKDMLSNSPSEPPRNGSLRDVSVQLFNSPAMQPHDLQMTMTMKNAEFDNDTYRLFTQEYVDDGGAVVHANDVPVTVSARDYSFNGSGMVLYWNDVDKKLKSLEITHGKDLTVNNAELSPQSASTTQATAIVTTSPPAAAPGTAAPPVSTPASPPAPQHRYTATFYDNVRIIQASDDFVQADRMDVDFVPKGAGGPVADQAPAEPSPTPTAAIPSTLPSPTPATQPSPQPIHILWTGIMRMIPTDPTAPPLGDGKAIVRLLGSPLKVHQPSPNSRQALDLQCNDLSYRTDDSSAHLTGQVVLKQTKADGLVSTVEGQTLDFSRQTHLAMFAGPGRSRLPDPNDPKSVLKAGWTQGCRVRMYDLPNNQTEIERADLLGSVLVTHPRFLLTAKKMVDLQFDAPADSDRRDSASSSSPPLRQITAYGDANCIVHETGNPNRQISGQVLRLTRAPGPDGKLFAKQIVCTDSVRALDDDQELNAGRLKIDLLPSTRKNAPVDDIAGQAALDRFEATKDVTVRGKDGSFAQADDLTVQMIEDHPHVKLVGSSDQPAMVKNKTSTIIGPIIEFAPHDQTASVDGPGEFDGIQQAKNPTEKPRPLQLIWQKNASLDGKTNLAVVTGSVTANSRDEQGQDSASCDRIVATLVDVAPTTAPLTQAAKQPTFADSDFMKNKQVRLLSLQMDPASGPAASQPMARVESYVQDAGGFLLHQYDLLSRQIDVEPSAKRVTVNGPGDIVSKVQTPPSTQPATQPSSGEASSGISGAGDTVIDWQKLFSYDDSAHSALIEGDITIVHTGNTSKTQSLRLDHADVVQVEFYSDAPQQNSAPADQPPGPKLKRVTATGGMVIRTSDKTIDCGEIDFDPVTEIMTCRAGQLRKVTIVDDNNISSGTCSEATFNVKTQELKKMTDVTGQGR